MSSRRKLLIGLVATLAGCARVGVPTPAPMEGPGTPAAEMTSNSLSGVATLGGRRVRVLIQMVTDGRGRGTARLDIPDLPLTAEGAAEWRGYTLELDLRYEGECPGDLRIRAKRTADAEQLEGTLSAKDCTGEESGGLVLEIAPRPSGGPALTPRVESAATGA